MKSQAIFVDFIQINIDQQTINELNYIILDFMDYSMYFINKFIGCINFGYIVVYFVLSKFLDSFEFNFQIAGSYKNYQDCFKITDAQVREINYIAFIYFFSLNILINSYLHIISYF